MAILTETHSFCDICQRMVCNAVTPHSADIAVCENCLKEFEAYKLQSPGTTLNEFAALKRSI